MQYGDDITKMADVEGEMLFFYFRKYVDFLVVN
jgi:hypothetical protein